MYQYQNTQVKWHATSRCSNSDPGTRLCSPLISVEAAAAVVEPMGMRPGARHPAVLAWPANTGSVNGTPGVSTERPAARGSGAAHIGALSAVIPSQATG